MRRHRCLLTSTALVGGCRPPLVGFVGLSPAPLHRHPLVSYGRTLGIATDSGLRCLNLDPLRPRRFTRPRRFAPPPDSQACCILQPILGFDTFRLAFRWSQPRKPVHCWTCSLPVTDLRPPRIASLTLRRSSLPRSRVASLRPLPPRTFRLHRSATLVGVAVSSAVSSCRIDGTWSLEALLRGGVCTFDRLMQTTEGLSFLGLVPLRGFLTLEPCDSSGISEAPCTSTVPRMRVPFALALVPSVAFPDFSLGR